MEYYIVVFVYRKEKYYFIWLTDEKDEFLTEGNKILFWKSIKEVKSFANKNGIILNQAKEVVYDIDVCEEWCHSSKKNVDCNIVLDLWNIFLDLHTSLNQKYLGNDSKLDKIYEKLFYGNNLPTINTTVNKYIPIFTNNEIKQIKNVLISGVYILKKTLS